MPGYILQKLEEIGQKGRNRKNLKKLEETGWNIPQKSLKVHRKVTKKTQVTKRSLKGQQKNIERLLKGY